MKRRDFLRNTLLAGAALQFPHIWIKNARANSGPFKITILQTNDTHSRIDPFPMDGGRYQGLGGAGRRATLVKQVRRQNPNTLLLDAGDVFQGTPYFNIYKGKLNYEVMTRCGYDVGTIGNHEFDNGVEALADAMNEAHYEMVNCNYDFGDTPLKNHIKTLVIRELGPVKVGITGVGIHFVDLVTPPNHEGVTYNDPVKPLKSVVKYLRKDLGCNLVIVLSHLGLTASGGFPADPDIAYQVNGIDWIVGGHTHTFMKEPEVVKSKGGHTTRILQVGWAGVEVGKSDLYFEDGKLIAAETGIISVDSEIAEIPLAVENLG